MEWRRFVTYLWNDPRTTTTNNNNITWYAEYVVNYRN